MSPNLWSTVLVKRNGEFFRVKGNRTDQSGTNQNAIRPSTHWGKTGGTLVSMDKEIRVNMGNSIWRGADWPHCRKRRVVKWLR
jgi:hypothetical protein